MGMRWYWLVLAMACTGSPYEAPSGEDSATNDSEDTDNTADTGAGSDTAGHSDTGDTSSPAGVEIEWVRIEAGNFWMGSEAPEGEELEWPAHEVAIATFEMARIEITSGTYVACHDAGSCDPLPSDDGFCYWDRPEHAERPVTCASWFHAVQVCDFVGGRLPTEAEWEFAARSRGRDIEFPWGSDAPSCDFAVIDNQQGLSCGETLPPPGCSRPAGNTDQGVCDMAGSLFEWTEDWLNGYDETPVDGTANESGNQVFRVMRGGAIGSAEPPRTRQRTYHEPEFFYGGMGIRCARSVRE